MDRRQKLFLVLVSLFVFSWFFGGKAEFPSGGSKGSSVSLVNGNSLDVYYFYGQGCPHCARVAPLIAEMEQKYPLRIHKFDIYTNRSSISVFDEYSNLYGLPSESRAVPTVFVSDTYLVGDEPILQGFEDAVKKALQETTLVNQTESDSKPAPATVATVESEACAPEKSADLSCLSLLAITTAALVDSINPCAIAILVFLIGARVLVGDLRKRALKVGLSFCLSVFIAYFLFGMGLLVVVQVSGFSGIFSLLVGFFAMLVGVLSLKTVFWGNGGGFKVEVPESLKPVLMKLLKGVTSPLGAFVMGFVAVCFELPCSGGPYLFILGQLANSATRLQAIPYLLFYNFVFVLPLILISLLLYSNFFSLSRIREWNEGNRRLLHLASGLVMVGLGFLVIPVSQVFQILELFLRCFRVVGLPIVVTMFLCCFISYASRKNLGSKLVGRVGRVIPLVFLSVVALFVVTAPSHAQGDGASIQIFNMKLGYPISWGPIGNYPFYSPRCPGDTTDVYGTFDLMEYIPPHTSVSLTYGFVVYGKYKSEPVWNPLISWLPAPIDRTCDTDEACTYYGPDIPWFFPFKLPKPPKEDSSGVFQVWVLGRACIGEACDYIPSVTPKGVPKNFQAKVKGEFEVFAIKEIKIEPDNPETTKPVKFTAELTSDLGLWSSATPTVSWEVEPKRRKTMSPHGGGKALDKKPGNGNPWTYTPPKDTHGEKTVKAKVTWEGACDGVEKEKDYKLLFRKNDMDYPELHAPNWFIYWSDHDDKAVTTRAFDHTSAIYKYGAGPGWGATNPNTFVTTLHPQAARGCGPYWTGLGVDNPIYSLPAVGININHLGSDCAALVIGHERTHVDIINNWEPGGIWFNETDSDCDLIPDYVENTLPGFDPNNPRSQNYMLGGSPAYEHVTPPGTRNCTDPANLPAETIDEEMYCDLQGQGARATGKEDWANPGKQTKPVYRRVIIETGTNATLSGTYIDEGKDTDGDGLFDFLTIKAGINVVSAGTYSLYGNLIDSEGNLISIASNETFYFNTGSNFFELNFDGLSIRRSRTNGPYTLRDISFVGNGPDELLENAFNTTAYNFKQFEQPKAELTGSFSESAIDTNGNSLFDTLDISVAINVTEAGYYTVIADLKNEGILVSSTSSSYLNTGEQNVVLSFDGLEIRSFRSDGPYSLNIVEVVDQDYNQTDIIEDAYNTSAYLYTQFEKPKAEFTGKFSDFGVDTDSNGLFNILRVEAEVDVQEAGNYTFSVDLSDIYDNEITSNYTYVLLSPGIQNVTLNLNGAAIGDNGVDGPYVLSSLELLQSDGTLLSAERYYRNTTTYLWSQFERAGKIIGKVVTQDGTAVENALISINYANDTFLGYTYTDNNGNYSFRGLETGTYHLIAVPMDPTLNVERANASVTKGQTTEVDFTVSSRVQIFGDVAVLSHSSHYDSLDNLWIAGEVQNIGDHTIQFTKITITFYDSSNQNITAKDCYTDLYYLLPRRKAPFETYLSNQSGALQVHQYTFNITHYDWPQSKEQGLQVLSSSNYTTKYPPALHVNGTIQNVGTTDAKNPKVVVTFYDAEGTALGSDIDWEDDSPNLPPGGNLTFDAAQYLYQLDQIAYYSVTAESDNYALVPEYPYLLMMSLFMTLTLMAAVIGRRKQARQNAR